MNLDNVNLIKREALAMCVDNVFSSFICVLALSSVIKRPINVHYPDFGLLLNRLVFDCEIFPRANDSFCLNSFGDPINILLCNISNNSENDFTANHFVSLIKHTTSKKGQSTLALSLIHI